MTFEKPRRRVKRVYIHCSASDHAHHDDVSVMDQWHCKRGWSEVGYHFFIKKDGELQRGRPIEKTPAAQANYNSGTIAICLHGLEKPKFTDAQFETLRELCAEIDEAYDGKVTFHGHCEVAAKSCPVFDYREVLDLDAKGRLGAGSQNSVSAVTAPDPDIMLRVGADGWRVKALQKQLTALGYHVGQVDGDYGRRTRAAVLAFQADNDLDTDGIAGPKTLAALDAAQKREVGEERQAAGLLSLADEGSRIADASVKQASAGGMVAAGGALGVVSLVGETMSSVREAVSPFSGLLAEFGPLLAIAALAIGGFIVWQAVRAGRARVEDHRTGKTS